VRETESGEQDRQAIHGEELHRQVFERNLAVQLLIDPRNGRIVEANPAACRFYGYTREQLCALRVSDINTAPQADIATAMKAASTERQKAFHFRHRIASGEIREVEVHSGPVDLGGVTFLYSIVHDITDRNRAERALAESEGGFRLLFADHPLPMWVYAADDLRFLEVNAAAVSKYGWTRDEFLALRILDIRPPEDVPRLLASLQGGRATREPLSTLWRHRLKDDRIIDVEVVSHTLEFAGQQAVLVVAQDVTERNRAEQALRASEEKHRAILEGIEEGYYEVDLEGTLLFSNEALRRMLGYERGDMRGLNCADCTDAPNALRVKSWFAQVLDTGRPVQHADWEVVRADGTRRAVESSISVIRGADGAPTGFRGLLIDVTARRQRESALRESEERFRRLVEMSPDAIAIHSEGAIVFCNTAGARLVGARTVDDLLGRSILEFVHEESKPLVIARMRYLAEHSEAVPFVEQKVVRVDGSVIEVEAAGSPFTYRDKKAVQLVIRDISARKRADKLQKALYRIAQTTSAMEDMLAFYQAIHGIVGELMYAENFYIALQDSPETIALAYFVDEVDEWRATVRPGKSLTHYVLRTGLPVLATPAVCEELERQGEIELVGPPSVDWLGVPLKRGDETFGVLVVQSYTEAHRFTEEDRDLLTFVSQHVATAIDRRRASDALRESEARFRTLAETAPCAIFIYQGEGFRYANPAMASISGYSREELTDMSFWDTVHPDFRETVRDRGLARQRGEELPDNYEFKIVRKDGEERWVDFSAGAIEIGGRAAALGTAFDITERKRAEEQIKNLAYHDALTGLPNRLLFNDRLTVAVAQAHRTAQRLAVLFLDLDRFKIINDSLGHTLGDRLLQGVAERLQSCVREGDTVARLGGDEFTLLLPGIMRAIDAAKVAEKILDVLKQPYTVEGSELFVTASIGISLYPEDGVDAESLVKNADTAMYRAKEQGRDNYQLYTPAMNARAVERLALENSLRQALARKELLLHYQPLLDLGTGRVHGVEALLRWQHPERGLVPPSDFISIAEVTGLILPMGFWILRTACAQARAWHDLGHPNLTVAVNLSARQFSQPDLGGQVKQALEETGLPARYLDLEITETNAMQNAEATIHTLRELKALGVRVSIDDFGIGYSSLNYLKRLPIDTLKIDQSFVRDITTDPDDAAIATAVIALAHTLKLKVVGEGVETEEQLAFLAARHCDRMQGYLFSKPLPPAECEAFLARNRPL
jgi:diguanylate cyclase (GGDEF)-like protein/PAS domain S-box-containing protein